MARKYILVAALTLGLVGALGVVSLGRTLSLGAAASHTNDALIARQTRQLDRFEASLSRRLAATAPAPQPSTVSGTPAAAQRVVYVRPKPRIVTVHRSHGDDGYEASGEADSKAND